MKVHVDPSKWNIRTKFKQFVPEQSKQVDITAADPDCVQVVLEKRQSRRI